MYCRRCHARHDHFCAIRDSYVCFCTRRPSADEFTYWTKMGRRMIWLGEQPKPFPRGVVPMLKTFVFAYASESEGEMHGSLYYITAIDAQEAIGKFELELNAHRAIGTFQVYGVEDSGRFTHIDRFRFTEPRRRWEKVR